MKRERVCRDGGFLFLDAMGGAFLVTTAVLLVLMLAAQSLQGLAVWEEKEAARRWFRQRMDAATAEPLPENIQVRDEATPLGGSVKTGPTPYQSHQQPGSPSFPGGALW